VAQRGGATASRSEYRSGDCEAANGRENLHHPPRPATVTDVHAGFAGAGEKLDRLGPPVRPAVARRLTARQVRAAVAHRMYSGGALPLRPGASRRNNRQLQLEVKPRPPADPRFDLQLRFHRARELAADREAEPGL